MNRSPWRLEEVDDSPWRLEEVDGGDEQEVGVFACVVISE